MLKYLFGTGIISVITGTLPLVRTSRDTPFTWRTALLWLSWGISVALAVGAIVDVRRASRGQSVPDDSPIRGKEERLARGRRNR